jgi:preprotein translocase subunit SecD
VEDPEAAVDLIGKTALLEFKNEEGETQLTGAHLVNAKSSFDQFSRSIVLIEFDKIGAKEFGEATKNNVGKVLAITLDGKEISAISWTNFRTRLYLQWDKSRDSRINTDINIYVNLL